MAMSNKYYVYTRSTIDGSWTRQYPTFIPLEVKGWRKWFHESSKINPTTPFLDKVETVNVAKEYLDRENVQDVSVVCEWYSDGGYGEWGSYTVWQNGKWI